MEKGANPVLQSTSRPRADDAKARFAGLLAQHRGIALKVAATYCRDPDDRADLAQEIAAQLWRAFEGYDPARSFSTWMYRIALNVAISQVRSDVRRRRHHRPLDAAHETGALADGSDGGLEGDAGIRALYRVIDALGPLDRALALLYLEDRSQREIAEVMGLSESNVGTRMHRLKQRIRDQFQTPARQSLETL